MRLQRFAGFLVFTAVLLSLRVFAAEFIDDMTMAGGAGAAQYIGLKPYSGNVSELSLKSMLTFASIASPKGRAVYRVNNAGEVTAGIYTFSGTAVSQGGDGFVMGKGGIQASWSEQANAVYTNIGGPKQLGLSDISKPQMNLIFLPVETQPAADSAGYGVNIYYSLNGTSFSRSNATLTKYTMEALCYEEYTAHVPAAAKYVAVEINDVTSFPLESGGVYKNNNEARYTRLALVRISGEGLIMGETVAEISPSSPAGESQPSGRKASQEAEINLAANAPVYEKEEESEQEKATDKSKEKSSPSKFEGTIVSSSKTGKAQPSRAARSDGEPKEKDETGSESISESEPPRDQEIVYELRREKKGGLLESGVTVYIIVVTGTIVLLLLFGKKR